MSESRTMIVNPSVVEYDYRIAWTWEEMDKRNKSNIMKDKIRIWAGMPGRAYGEGLVSQWTDHYGKDRGLVLKNGQRYVDDWR